MSKKIVIFDLDGTLVDSSDNISSAINFVRADSGLPPLHKDFITSNINKDDINPAEVFYGTNVFTARQKELFETFYLDICTNSLMAYDGVVGALERFKKGGFYLSVATNGASMFAVKMLASLKIDSFFDHLVGADLVESPKPNPDMLNLILDRYAYGSGDFVPFMVGDSIKDIKSAARAGVKSAFASWGFGEDVDGADIRLDNASEIELLFEYFS